MRGWEASFSSPCPWRVSPSEQNFKSSSLGDRFHQCSLPQSPSFVFSCTEPIFCLRKPGLAVPTLCSPVCFSLSPEPQLPLHSSTRVLRLWLLLLSSLWMGRCWGQLEKYYCVPSLFPFKIKACFQFSDSPPPLKYWLASFGHSMQSGSYHHSEDRVVLEYP